MIQILEPKPEQKLVAGEVVKIIWDSTAEYGLYYLYYRTADSSNWLYIGCTTKKEYYFTVPAITGNLYFKVVGAKSNVETQIGVCLENAVILYDVSSKLYNAISNTSADRISVIDKDEYALIKDTRITFSNGLQFNERRVLEDFISGEELKVMQVYTPFDVEKIGNNFVISEFTNNRFYQTSTDEDGYFSTPKIFTCGYVGIAAGLELGGKSPDSLYWEDDLAINYQATAKKIRGVSKEVSIIHQDISGLEFVVPLSKDEGEILRKTNISVKTIDSYGDAISEVYISPLDATTNEEGILTKTLYYLQSQTLNITAQKEGWNLTPQKIEKETEEGKTIEVTFVGKKTYSVQVYVLQQYNKKVDFSVSLVITQINTGERWVYNFSNGEYKTPAIFEEGTYEVKVERENMFFSPNLYISYINQDSNKFTFICKTYSIRGQVKDFAGNPCVGISIVCDNKTVMTDTDGNFVISGLPKGQYVLYPYATKDVGEKSYRRYFIPENRTVQLENDVFHQDFYERRTYTAVGHLINCSDYEPEQNYTLALFTDDTRLFYPGQPVSLELNGVDWASRGWFYFASIRTSGLDFTIENLPSARYLLVPIKIFDSPAPFNKGWTFEPSEKEFRIIDSNVSGIEFNIYSGSISGKIVDEAGSGIEGIKVELVGGEYDYEVIENHYYPLPKQTHTDAEGVFRFDKQRVDNYEIYPLATRDCLAYFAPEKKVASISKNDLSYDDVIFVLYYYPQHHIRGFVHDEEGSGISVEIRAISGFEIRNSLIGRYSNPYKLTFSSLGPNYDILAPESQYVVYPVISLWDFRPKSYSIDLRQDVSGLDFEGYNYDENKPIPKEEGAEGYKLSGKVIDIFGSPIASIAITGCGVVYTNASGEYQFENVNIGDYTIYPACLDVSEIERVDYTFADDARYQVSVRNRNISGLDFVAIPKYSISGRVIDKYGSGIGGINVLFNQHHSRIISLNSSGVELWSWDSGLFLPVEIEVLGDTVCVTNMGKHNIVLLHSGIDGVELERVFGSDLPTNGIPGERSGIGLLDFPSWGIYEGNVYKISENGNKRFIVFNEKGELLFGLNFLGIDAELLKSMNVKDTRVNILAGFKDKNFLLYYDLDGSAVGGDVFESNVKHFDAMSYGYIIGDYTYGMGTVKEVAGIVEYYKILDSFEEEVIEKVDEWTELTREERYDEVISGLSVWAEKIESNSETWVERIISFIEQQIEQSFETTITSENETYFRELYSSILANIRTDFTSFVTTFLTLVSSYVEQAITNYSNATGKDEKMQILASLQFDILDKIVKVYDEILNIAGTSIFGKAFSDLLKCVLTNWNFLADFLETFFSSNESWSLSAFKKTLMEDKLQEALVTGKITQQQYEELTSLIESIVTNITVYIVQQKTLLKTTVYSIIQNICRKSENWFEQVEQQIIIGMDETYLSQIKNEAISYKEQISTSISQNVDNVKQNILEYFEQQLNIIIKSLENVELYEIADWVGEQLVEMKARIGASFNVFKDNIQKCFGKIFNFLLTLFSWSGASVLVQVISYIKQIVERRRDTIVTRQDDIVIE